ncbi:MAG TPA: hypothetical protein VGK67_02040 [Myxococcales bacterium]|jgi:hypothetical protein
MPRLHLVRFLGAGLPLLGVVLALAGCVDEKKVLGVIEQCPKATARLGNPYKISRTWKIGSPGVGQAPVPGCTHKARIEGPQRTSELWFNEKDSEACFHLYTPTGETRDLGGGASEPVIAVTDLRTCTDGLQ